MKTKKFLPNNQPEPATSNNVTDSEFIFKSPEKVSVKNFKRTKNPSPKSLPVMPAPNVKPGPKQPSKLVLSQKILQLGVNAVKNTNARFSKNPVGHADIRYVLEICLNDQYKFHHNYINRNYLNLKYPVVKRSHICLIIDDSSMRNNIPMIKGCIRVIREKLWSHNLAYIKNIITITQLRENLPTPESQNTFRKSFELFLIDRRLKESILSIMGRVMQSYIHSH